MIEVEGHGQKRVVLIQRNVEERAILGQKQTWVGMGMEQVVQHPKERQM